MTYEETKQYGAHSIINTTFYGYGHYVVNDREKNYVTDNEFFTDEEAPAAYRKIEAAGIYL